jgi:hypothetical protein
VVVKPCRLPTLSDHYRHCELFGIPEDTARLRFREFMQNREASETIAFPGKVVAVSNVPIRVPTHFMGREEALAAIEAGLATTRAASQSPRCPACAGSARRCSRRPLRNGIAATIGRPGGSGHRPSRRCAPIWWRLAYASAGRRRTKRRS